MNDEQVFRLASIKALSVDLLTAAHDQDEGRLLMVMAELSELFRVVRMDIDTRRRDDVQLEPETPAARSVDALKALVEAEFMRQVCISHHEPVPPEAFGLENPPVSDEPIDVAPRVFEIADDDDDDEAGTTDVDAELRMSAMYDATTKWV